MKLRLFSILFIALACTYLSAYAQALDRNIFTTNGPVYSTLQSGDTLYVGGDFKQMGYGTRKLVRFANGSTKPDLTFPQFDANSTVNAMEPDGNGGYYIGGKMYYYNGTRLNPNNDVAVGIIHILSNYSLDPAFTITDIQSKTVKCLKKQGNRLYTGGDFVMVNGTASSYIAALDATSGTLINWAPATPNNVISQIEATDSLVFITGSFNYVGSHNTPDHFAALAATDGSYSKYLSEGNYSLSGITAIKINDSKLYLGGTFNNIGHPAKGIAKVSSTTAAQDVQFPEINGFVYALLDDDNGGYYIGGSFSRIGDVSIQNLAHIRADGTVDTDFNISVNNSIYCLASDGANLYIGGYFTIVNGNTRNYAAAINRYTGALTAWNPNANGAVRTMVYANDAVYMGGGFTTIKDSTRNYAAAVTVGNILSAWNPNPDNDVYQLITNNTGTSIFMCGDFYSVNDWSHFRLAKVNSTTGEATSWKPDVSDRVYSIALYGSQLYIGGSFHYVNNAPREYFAELDTTAGYLTGFKVDANSTIQSLKVIDSKLYLAGSFTQLSSSYYAPARNHDVAYIARINMATRTVDDWNAGLGNTVLAVSGSENNIVLGGTFNSVNGGARNKIAAVDLTTNQLTSFSPKVTSWSANNVNAIYVYNNEVFAGGNFSYYRPDRTGLFAGVIALDVDSGNVSRYFDYSAYQCSAIAISNNQLFIGGQFTTFYDSASYSGTRNIFRYNLATYDLSNNQLTGDEYKLNNKVNVLLTDTNDGVIAAGDFTLSNFVDRQYLAAISLTTGQATNWISRPDFMVKAMALKDTSLYLGGNFTSILNSSNKYIRRRYLAAVSTKTGNPTNWKSDANAPVQCMALRDTILYVGGYFTKVQTITRNYAAAIGTNAAGILHNWTPNTNYAVNAIQPVGDSIYIGGNFVVVKGTARKYLALVNNTDGSLYAWNPNPNYIVNAFTIDSSNLYIGGGFSTVASQNRRSVAAFNLVTHVLTTFDPELKNRFGNTPSLQGIALYGNNLYMGSYYNKESTVDMDTIKGKPRHLLGAANTTTGNTTPFNPNYDNRISTLTAGRSKLFIGADYTGQGDIPSTSFFYVFSLEPLEQASNLSFTNRQPTSVKVKWTNGSGEGRIVIVKEGSATDTPEDGVEYNANAAFGQGSKAGSSYVIYKDNGDGITVTNLLPNHTYYFAVYEYNGTGSGTEYLQSPALTGSITTPCSIYTNIVSPAGPVTICQGDSAVLIAIDSMSSYLWNTGATTRSITVKTSGSYTVNIADSNACTGTSQPVVVNYQSCGKPKGLAVKNITASSAILRWRSMPCAVSYSVQIKPANTTKWKAISTTDTVLNLTSLTPGTTYNWRVKTVCSTSKSSFNNGNDFTTATSLTTIANRSSTQEEEAFSATVYPNPANTTAAVQISGKYKPVTIALTDITGKVLWKTTNITANSIDIPVSNLTTGVYLISITHGDKMKMLKLVKTAR